MSPQLTRTRGTIRRRPVSSHPVGGIRYIIGTYLPGVIAKGPEPTPEMHLEDGDEPGGADDGFHRTDTTDFGVLLSGNMALELDDGAEVVLSPGDVLIAERNSAPLARRWGRAGHPGFFHHRSPPPIRSRLADEVAIAILGAARANAARWEPDTEQFLRLAKDENQFTVDKTS